MTNPMTVQEMVRRRVRRRRRMRRVRTALLVAVGVLGAGGAAFGIDRMVVALHHYYAGRPGPKGSSTTSGAGGSITSTTSTVPGPPACQSPQLGASVYYWIGTGSAIYEIVTLNNIGGSVCTLAGYPTLGASAADGTPLPAPTTDVATLGSVPGGAPAATTPVSLAPGTRAWFEVSFPENCDQVLAPGASAAGVANACYAGTYLQVTPPRAANPLLVNEPLHFDYGTAGFQVGPFQSTPPPSRPPVPAA
ncbi:MAG TPA: DUF4232 domain-containing protein [Acidimicrobiales bacterium]|nr:DUF4232 domain-containing protein [Acidimicrobiales bacterium]